jgi:WD40 repeat protein
MSDRFPVALEPKPFALLIGNEQYKAFGSLRTPVADVKALAAALSDRGFETSVSHDIASAQDMLGAVDLAIERARRQGATAFLFYYAGHGCSGPDGRNWLLPTDISAASDWQANAAPFAAICDKVKDLTGIARVVILDACREPRIAGSPSDAGIQTLPGKGFIPPAAGALSPDEPVTLLVFSTQPEARASDTIEPNDHHSPFAKVLLQELRRARDGDDLVDILMKKAPKAVAELTRSRKRGSQIPTFSTLHGACIVPIPLTRSGGPDDGTQSETKDAELPPRRSMRRSGWGSIGRPRLLAGASVVALLFGVGLFWTLRPDSSEPEPPARSGELVEAKRAADLARAKLFVARAAERLRAGDAVHAAGLANAALDLSDPADRALTESAALTVQEALPAIGPPAPSFPIPGLPPGKGDFVTNAAFSPSGDLFAIESGNRFRLFDLGSGKMARWLEGGSGDAIRVSFTGDGATFVVERGQSIEFHPVGRSEGPPKIWRFAAPRERETGIAAVSPDGSVFIDMTLPRAISVRSSETGEALYPPLSVDGRPLLASFSPDGALFALSVQGSGVVVFETRSGRRRFVAPATGETAHGQFSPDGKLLLVVQKTARLYDVERGTTITLPSRLPLAAIGGNAFFVGRAGLVAAIEEKGVVSIWSPRDGKKLASFKAGATPLMNYIQSRDGEILTFETADRRLVSWLWRAETKLADEPISWQIFLGASLSADGASLRVVEDGRMTTKRIARPRSVPLTSVPHGFKRWSASEDGSIVAATHDRGTTIWSTRTGAILKTIASGKRDEGGAPPLAVSPSGRYVAAARTTEENDAITLSTTENGVKDLVLAAGATEPLQNVTSLGFSQDERFLFELGTDNVRVWSVERGEPLFSRRASIPGPSALRQGSGPQGEPLFEAVFRNQFNQIAHVVLDAKGHAGSEGWLPGHSRYVTAALFGRAPAIVTAAQDHSVRVWNAAAGREIATTRIDENVSGIALSPDGETVYILGEYSSLYLWRWPQPGVALARVKLSDCSDGLFRDATLLCRETTDPSVRHSMVRDPTTGVALAQFGRDAELSADGRFVLEQTPGSATLTRVYPTLSALREAARVALAPYAEEVKKLVEAE